MERAIVVERAAPGFRFRDVASSVGTILLHIQNDVSLQQRLQLALGIARATGGHLMCIQITPIEAYVTTGTLGGVFALGRAMEKVDLEDQLLRSKIVAQLQNEDVSWDYEHVTAYETNEIVRRGALADLVVLSRDSHLERAQRPQMAVLGDILFGSRTPILIPGSAKKVFDPTGTAVIAWNGSIEAANAVRASLGMLKLASDVRVVRCREEKEIGFPDTRLAEFLSRHGIHADVDIRQVREDFADDIVEYATAHGGSYIVLGAYSQSRATEFIFGGVTRKLLSDCSVPLIMAH